MIESKANEKIKHLEKLHQKKYRDKYQQFLVFGEHLIDEAKKRGCVVETYTTKPQKGGILISANIMKQLTKTVTVFDQIALCKKSRTTKPDDKVLVLDDVQDPDNLGALLRSALAFGFEKIIISLHSADAYNEKAIRASQGAIFHLEIIRCNLIDYLSNVKDATIISTTAKPQKQVAIPDGKLTLILGNEGAGVSAQVEKFANLLINIPTKTVESLNVVVAGSIIMNEIFKLQGEKR